MPGETSGIDASALKAPLWSALARPITGPSIPFHRSSTVAPAAAPEPLTAAVGVVEAELVAGTRLSMRTKLVHAHARPASTRTVPSTAAATATPTRRANIAFLLPRRCNGGAVSGRSERRVHALALSRAFVPRRDDICSTIARRARRHRVRSHVS